MSVTVVNTTVPESAGSMPIRFSNTGINTPENVAAIKFKSIAAPMIKAMPIIPNKYSRKLVIKVEN